MTEENPIIEEIRRTREQLLAEYNGDLSALVTSLQKSAAERTSSGQPGRVSPEQQHQRTPAIIKKVG